jgi:tetratricopeptide (TPR) repeat protein/transcriptional regulator with XRE-family HTH domain
VQPFRAGRRDVTRGYRGEASLPPGPARDLVDLLRRLRQCRGLSVGQIAVSADVSRSHVSEVLRGWKTPSPDVAASIARALGGSESEASNAHQWAGQARDVRYYHRARGAAPMTGAGHQRVTPRELPSAVAGFTGRSAELDALTGLLDRPGRRAPGVVVISAISGTAGVGKTALAVHWAHTVVDSFPDGQLYVNLRGYDPGQPVPASDALAGLLRSLGVPGQDIPPDEDERAARFRSLLAGKRMLVVLDNAGSAGQVRPLLPGAESCAVVVTSRDALAGLVAHDGVTRLDLDALPLRDAVGLLGSLIGARAAADPGAAAELAGQCCRLPLTLRVAAELAAARPGVPLAALVSELADLGTRLDLLESGEDPPAQVRVVFSWSYRHLDAGAARTFRLLGLHPGPGLEPYAAAALTGASMPQTRRALDVLARAHLIQPAEPGRYGMHDLLRAYARELAASQEAGDDQRERLTRLFDYYLYAAATAMDTLYPAGRQRCPRLAGSASLIPPLTGPAAAREWLAAERAALVAVAGHAATYGWPGHATRLAATLHDYFQSSGHFLEAITIYRHALDAARSAGDRAGEATALTQIGVIYWEQSRLQQAYDHYRQALALFRAEGDRAGEAQALGGIGASETGLGRYEQAGRHQQEAAAIYSDIGDRDGQARAIGNLGRARLRQGHHQEAAGYYRQSLDLYRETGDRNGEALALARLGTLDLRLGLYERAEGYLRAALALFHETGEKSSAAETLLWLGQVYLRLGRHEQASGNFEQALATFREIGDPAQEAEALNGLGEVLLQAGEAGKARAHHAAALELTSEIGTPLEQARAHSGLARACHADGDLAQARHHWQQALTRYTAIGAPEAKDIRALLATITDDDVRATRR